jgi:hypothetical protein
LFPLFATDVYNTSSKFATGINDTKGTGGKLTAGDFDTDVKFVTSIQGADDKLGQTLRTHLKLQKK